MKSIFVKNYEHSIKLGASTCIQMSFPFILSNIEKYPMNPNHMKIALHVATHTRNLLCCAHGTTPGFVSHDVIYKRLLACFFWKGEFLFISPN